VTGAGHPVRTCVSAYIPNPNGVVAAHRVRTSRAGRYRITGLKPGRYQVQFAPKSGCADPGEWLTQTYPDNNSPFPPEHGDVPVRAGKNTPGIDGHLIRGGEIAGLVGSSSGRPLAGICVILDVEFPNGGETDELNTDKSGHYADSGLVPGAYTVKFMTGCGNNGNYGFQYWHQAKSQLSATKIKVSGDEVFNRINVTLRPGAVITGTVRAKDARHNSIASVCVSAFGVDGVDEGDTMTSLTGHFRISGLAAAKFFLIFDPSCGGSLMLAYVPAVRQVSLKAGQVRSGFDVDLVLTSGISGVVTDSRGHPVGDVCVLVDDRLGSFAKTKPNGTYSIAGVFPGSYTVQFFGGCGNGGSLAPQFYPGSPTSVAAKPVRFLAGKVTGGVNPVMRPGGTVAGTVTDAGGHPLSGICASAMAVNQPNQSLLVDALFGTFERSRNGHYELRNLAPGSYQLSFGGQVNSIFGCFSDKYALQWYRAAQDPTTQDNISVTAGGTTSVDARISRSGSISGRVTNGAGRGLGNICVGLANPATRQLLDFNVAGGITDRDGRYELVGATPGRYLVQFSDCRLRVRYPSQWYPDQASVAAARIITIRANDVTPGIDATMGSGGAISGVVTGPSGAPMANVCVSALDASSSFGETITNKRGQYEIPALATGRYQLFAFQCVPHVRIFGRIAKPGVAVVAPRTTTADLKLPPAGTLTGTVSGRAGRNRAGLGNVCVIVLPVSPTGTTDFGYTGPAGHYKFIGLAPGRYRVLIGDQYCVLLNVGGPSFAPQWYKDRATRATADLVTVTAGHTTTSVSATLVPFGAITGTVTSRGGGPVPGECVTAVPFRTPPDPFTGLVTPEVAITSATGRYALLGLPPASYKIEFSAGCGAKGFATQWWRGAPAAGPATPVTLRTSVITGVDAILRR
jgi:hypothetical protein